MSSGCARPEWQFSGPRKLAGRRPCKRGRRRSPRLERGRRSRSSRPGKLLSKTKSWLRKDCRRNRPGWPPRLFATSYAPWQRRARQVQRDDSDSPVTNPASAINGGHLCLLFSLNTGGFFSGFWIVCIWHVIVFSRATKGTGGEGAAKEAGG